MMSRQAISTSLGIARQGWRTKAEQPRVDLARVAASAWEGTLRLATHPSARALVERVAAATIALILTVMIVLPFMSDLGMLGTPTSATPALSIMQTGKTVSYAGQTFQVVLIPQ